jgi:hypothetical protein
MCNNYKYLLISYIYVFTYDLFKDHVSSSSIQNQKVEWLTSNELEMMWKKQT